MKVHHQNFFTVYPHTTSLQPSFNSTVADTIKSSQFSSFDNHSLNFFAEENQKKSHKRQNFSKKGKMLSFQQNNIRKVKIPEKAMMKRNSWCLMRNFVKGLHCIMSPEIFSIKDEVFLNKFGFW